LYWIQWGDLGQHLGDRPVSLKMPVSGGLCILIFLVFNRSHFWYFEGSTGLTSQYIFMIFAFFGQKRPTTLNQISTSFYRIYYISHILFVKRGNNYLLQNFNLGGLPRGDGSMWISFIKTISLRTYENNFWKFHQNQFKISKVDRADLFHKKMHKHFLIQNLWWKYQIIKESHNNF